MRKTFFLTVLMIITLNTYSQRINKRTDTSIVDTKRDRYLLLDSRIIESSENLELKLGHVSKDKHNPLFGEDKPWEPRFDNPYCSVIYDEEEGIYKCWYSIFIKSAPRGNSPAEGLPVDQRPYADWTEGVRTSGVCYATSKDGIHWEKPVLGLVEFEGNKMNNIVIVIKSDHCVTVFKDTHEPDPQKRYKAIRPAKANSVVWFSPDGIHWTQHIIGPIDNGDTNQGLFWDPVAQKYVLFTRHWGGDTTKYDRYGGRGRRIVTRSESVDFLKWSKPQPVIEGLNGMLQIHDMPVVRHAGIYIGMVGLFDVKASKEWCELAWSPNSYDWYRVCPGEPFIPNGQMGDYDWGCIFTSVPLIGKDKIRMYYGANDGPFMGWRSGYLALGWLRADGFAGYQQIEGGSNKTGTLTTIPVTVVGGSLAISADVVSSGYVNVTLLNENNKVLAQGELVIKTGTDAPIFWKDNFSLEKIKGQKVKLRFKLRDSKLYSFSFHE